MTTPNEELRARHVRALQNFASAYAADSENGQALRAAIAALAPAQEPAGGGEVDWMRSQLKALAKQASDDDMREKLHGLAAAITNPSRPYLATPTPQSGEAHPDDAAVDAFAAAMKAKLAEARAKGRSGWQDREDCPQQFLSDLLRGHVEKGDPRDVANFCMFLHQRGEAILPAPASPQGVSDAVVERALDSYHASDVPGGFWPSTSTMRMFMQDRMRAALEAVWPTAAGAAPEGDASYTQSEVAEAMEVLRGRHGSTALVNEVLDDMERVLLEHAVEDDDAAPQPGAQHGQEGRE